MLILEFESTGEAQSALAVINEIAAAWWAGQGYTVMEEGGVKKLIGKNAKTGGDEPDKTCTMTWAEISESPDGTYYFLSPVNDGRFANWRNYLPPGMSIAAEKELPGAWVSGD